jgi:hypothetical protein
MDHYGVTNKGYVIVQKVATLPTWTSADEGKMIYVEEDSKFYSGNNTGWVEGAGTGGGQSGTSGSSGTSGAAGSSSADIPRFDEYGIYDALHINAVAITINLKENYPGLEPGVAIAYVGALTYYISKDGVTYQSSIESSGCWEGYGCGHIGVNTVYLKITDEDSPMQTSIVTTYVIIQDAGGYCG